MLTNPFFIFDTPQFNIHVKLKITSQIAVGFPFYNFTIIKIKFCVKSDYLNSLQLKFIKMRLELTNFRCHSALNIDFKEDSITLLAGQPGQGKSTIIEAIVWVLYGSMQNIAHYLASKNSQTIVTLELDNIPGLGKNIIINRQNHPNRLTLTIGKSLTNELNQQEYEDAIAQSIIDAHFGNKEMFKFNSYIVQGGECAILKGSKKERLQLIESLSFREENPKDYLDKIDSYLIEARANYKVEQTKYDTEQKVLQSNLKSNPLPAPLTEKYPTITAETLILLDEELSTWQAKYDNEIQQENQRKIYENNIQRLTTCLAATVLPESSDTDPLVLASQIATDKNMMESIKIQLLAQQEQHDSVLKQEKDCQTDLARLNQQQQEDVAKEENRIQLQAVITHLQTEREKLLLEMNTIVVEEPDYSEKEKLTVELNDIMAAISTEEVALAQFTTNKLALAQQITADQTKLTNLDQQLITTTQQLQDTVQHQANLTDKYNNLAAKYKQNKEVSPGRLEIDPIIQTLLTGDDPLKILNGEIAKASYIEQEIVTNSAKAAQLGVAYDASLAANLANWQNNATNYTAEQNKLIRAKELNIAMTKLLTDFQTTLNDVFLKVVTADLRSFNYNIYDAIVIAQTKQQLQTVVTEYNSQLQQKILELLELRCPNCSIGLRWENEQLIQTSSVEGQSDNIQDFSLDKINAEIKNYQEVIPLLTTLINYIDDVLKLYQQYADSIAWLGAALDQLDTGIAGYTASLTQINDYCQLLQGITYYETPTMSAAQMQSAVSIVENNILLDQLELELAKQSEQMTEMTQLLDQYTVQINQLTQTINNTKVEIANLTVQIQTNQNLYDNMIEDKNNLPLWLEAKVAKLIQLQAAEEIINTVRLAQQNKTNLEFKINQNCEQLSVNINKINLLPVSNLEIIKASVTQVNENSKMLKTYLEQSQTVLASYTNQINTLEAGVRAAEKEQEKLNYWQQNLEKIKQKIEQEQTELAAYQQQLQSLGPQMFKTIQTEIKTLNEYCIIVKKNLELQEWAARVDQQSEELVRRQLKLAAAEELKCLAERVQYQCLEKTIKSINAALNELLGKIYDFDIYVELQLFKKIKSTKIVKPQISCRILYKGMEYANSNSLSGSETNRLNLGMMLALNLVSTSPLILLDECISFLDDRLKSKCARAIHELMNKRKTVIMTVHQSNEADYKNIITIDDTDVRDDSYDV